MNAKSIAAGLLACTAASPLFAQVASTKPATPAVHSPVAPSEPVQAEEEEEPETEIVVTGQRQRGAVFGDIVPEGQLNRADIGATAAASMAELLTALAPQTRSTRGRGGGGPVILLAGRRISGFEAIRDIPPEAIDRVDILPEEVALKYGYSADQRVVNIVLRRRFRAVTAQATSGFATAGGRTSASGELNFLRIQNGDRLNIDINYQQAGSLLESERDLIQSAPSRPYSLAGNIGAFPFGGEIDPALSALAGRTMTIAGVPATIDGRPSLGVFTGAANLTDLGPYRTLLPETEQLAINATLNRTLVGNVSATLTGRYQLDSSTSLLGLSTGTLAVPTGNPFSPFGRDVTLFRYVARGSPLDRVSVGQTGHLGLSVNGDALPWRWSLTSNYDRAVSDIRTGTGIDLSALQQRIAAGDPGINPFVPVPDTLIAELPDDRAHTITRAFNADLLFNGPLLTLPAGPVSTSVRAGVDMRDLSSRTLRSGLSQARDLSRDQASAQASLDIPITSRQQGFLSGLGTLSANVNAEVEHLSDFGTQRTLGGGLTWSPIAPLSLIASFTDEQGPPTMQQLGDPVLLTPNVRVFDFVRGETVDISQLQGGNPDLRADHRQVFKFGATLRPISGKNLAISANFTRNKIDNPIAGFPTATPEIEAAFPARFTRDPQGRLLRIDARPVNFARSDRSDIRWGVSFAAPFGLQAPQRAPVRAAVAGGPRGTGAPVPADSAGAPQRGSGGAQGARNGGAGGGPGTRGAGLPGLGRPAGGRIQFALYHTWHLRDKILVRPGVPVLDLLHGSAVGSSGGQPQHEIELQAGVVRDGLGARVSANWQSATTVRGGTTAGGATSSALRFSDLATANLRLFVDLGLQGALVKRFPWMRGARLSFDVDNLFDERLRVRDQSGAVPLSYQPAYLDPLGRAVRISFRKLFL